MPEGIEIEIYRRAAHALVGREIDRIDVLDPDYVRGGIGATAVTDALAGATVVGTRRRGKLFLVDLRRADEEIVLGLRFGMTGRLIVDGAAPIEQLEYSSDRDDPAWDRVRLFTTDGGSAAVRDPRRLGSIELDPDEDTLGVDAFELDGPTLRRLLAGSKRALKARLMDQAVIAGLGNLLTDEILWRAGLDPAMEARDVDDITAERLAAVIATTLAELTARGGSHTGDLQEHRRPGAICPLDGAPIERRIIGGRTTYACPDHQARTGDR